MQSTVGAVPPTAFVGTTRGAAAGALAATNCGASPIVFPRKGCCVAPISFHLLRRARRLTRREKGTWFRHRMLVDQDFRANSRGGTKCDGVAERIGEGAAQPRQGESVALAEGAAGCKKWTCRRRCLAPQKILKKRATRRGDTFEEAPQCPVAKGSRRKTCCVRRVRVDFESVGLRWSSVAVSLVRHRENGVHQDPQAR